MAGVTFEGAGKVYKDGTRALEALDLAIEDGEFMVLVGPSGLRQDHRAADGRRAGGDQRGQIRIGDQVVNEGTPGDRDIAMVFQNYALYPHMTVCENIGFALRLRRMPQATRSTRASTRRREILGLEELLDRKPRALSGGQRQRVAMGRAIVREPEVVPDGRAAVEPRRQLRVEMRAEIVADPARARRTTIYVTHDQVEAMTMGDRVAVLRGAGCSRSTTRRMLYDNPANVFVASFIGSPQMNLVQATVSGAGEDVAAGAR